jgi:predicted nucleic acid-binding protein
LRTLDRLSLRGTLAAAELVDRRAAVYAMLEEMAVLDLDRAVLARASQPFPTPLGTLDALHLASAILGRDLGGPSRFATHDVELARAARSVGFEVLGAPGA